MESRLNGAQSDVTGARLAYLANLVAIVSDAIISTDLQFRILSWNPAAQQLYGWESTEALGQVSRDLLQTQYIGLSHTAVDAALVQDGAWRGEIRQWRRDGALLYVQSSIATIYDEAGAPIGYVFVNLDITARKQAEAEVLRLNAELERRVAERTAQLEAINRELETFAYSVSHDLRAPLRSIDGFSNALLQEYGGQLQGNAEHYLQRIRAGVERMGGLIDGILALSRLSRREVRRQPVNLSALAAEIAATLARETPQRRVEVRIEPQLHAAADPELVRLVLENLLDNAWKFSARPLDAPAAQIEFGISPLADELVYYVRDNGVGFDMAYADKLFSPFQRLHRVTEFAGFGIGLATVQRIVHRHGGRIWAAAAEGQGATFFFTLDEGRVEPVVLE